jgi:hypothetical protein
MIIENMVCISLVYCNGVRMCVHPLWTEGVNACRYNIDRRSATWCDRLVGFGGYR